MASFASKIRANADYKAAAQSMGKQPADFKTQQAFQRVKAYAAKQASSTPASTSAPSNQPSQAPYAPTTVGGSYVNAGLGTIGDFMAKFPGNESIAGLGAGTIFDIGKTQANTGLAIAYNDAFLGSLGKYQSGQENLKTGNTSKLMGQEGAIARDLVDLQTSRSLEGTKYGYDKTLEGSKYTSDKSLEGSKYVADRGLEGTKYGYDSQERQIGLEGNEARRTLQQKTEEELRLRSDARGAIRSQNARFYG